MLIDRIPITLPFRRKPANSSGSWRDVEAVSARYIPSRSRARHPGMSRSGSSHHNQRVLELGHFLVVQLFANTAIGSEHSDYLEPPIRNSVKQHTAR